MPENSANLSLPFILPAQAQKHVTHNEALQRLDAVVQLVIEEFDATLPPASVEEGQVWALGASPSGLWVDQGGRLALWQSGAWVFVTPGAGWRAARGSDLRVWNGTDWVAPDLPELNNLDGLGVNASYDSVNRLAVSSPASLLTHDGEGHNLKINKAAVAETASLVFQTAWSGRAEMGTAGSDAFAIKVSPNGSDWTTAFEIDPVSARPTLFQGAQLDGPLTGMATTQSATDTTIGRVPVLRQSAGGSGIFGLGAVLAPPELDDLDATTSPSGFYRVSAETFNSANRPASTSDMAHLILTRHDAVSGGRQFFGSSIQSDWWHRLHKDDDWQPWRKLYDSGNILGDVGIDSDNTPTGAIIDRGDNTNGEYIRFADGTQICCQMLSSDAAAKVVWDFPVQFAAVPCVTGMAVVTGDPFVSAPQVVTYGEIATDAVSFAVTQTDTASKVTTPVHHIAIGRWW